MLVTDILSFTVLHIRPAFAFEKVVAAQRLFMTWRWPLENGEPHLRLDDGSDWKVRVKEVRGKLCREK